MSQNLEVTLVQNTSKIPEKEAELLILASIKAVNKVFAKLSLAWRFSKHYTLKLYDYKRGSFRGSHRGSKRQIIIRFNFDYNTKHKIYPYTRSYIRYKNMPKYQINDWQEDFVRLMCHELSHSRYGGNKEGEYKTELAAIEALNYFREFKNELNSLELNLKKDSRIVRNTIKIISQDSQWRKDYFWMRKYIKENNIEKKYYGKECFILYAPNNYEFSNGVRQIFCKTNKEGFQFLKENALQEKLKIAI